MYSIKIPGCLTLLLILLIVVMLVKELWPLIVGIAVLLIIYYYVNLLCKLYKDNREKQAAQYEPEDGEVFKVCPYCDAKVKVNTVVCPYCKHTLN